MVIFSEGRVDGPKTKRDVAVFIKSHLQSSVAEAVEQSDGDDAAQEAVQR